MAKAVLHLLSFLLCFSYLSATSYALPTQGSCDDNLSPVPCQATSLSVTTVPKSSSEINNNVLPTTSIILPRQPAGIGAFLKYIVEGSAEWRAKNRKLKPKPNSKADPKDAKLKTPKAKVDARLEELHLTARRLNPDALRNEIEANSQMGYKLKHQGRPSRLETERERTNCLLHLQLAYKGDISKTQLVGLLAVGDLKKNIVRKAFGVKRKDMPEKKTVDLFKKRCTVDSLKPFIEDVVPGL
jgi:hypothetical protein